MIQSRRALAIASGLLLAVALAVGAAALRSPAGHSIDGVLVLHQPHRAEDCRAGGSAPYQDIKAGTTVGARDASGRVIATSTLGPGEPAGEPLTPGAKVNCQFRFRLDVPDSARYQIGVLNRGEVSLTRRQLTERNWSVSLTLGLAT